MGEVGVGNDAVDRCGVRMPGSKIVCRSSDELRLADWLQMLWSIGAIAGPTLDEDGLDDVVTRCCVDPEIIDDQAQNLAWPGGTTREPDARAQTG